MPKSKAEKPKTVDVSRDILISEWKLVHAQAGPIDENADKGGADWRSLCVGWCLAKGLSVDDAYAFYQQMIPLNLF